MRPSRRRYLAGLLALFGAVGCSSPTEPAGPVSIRVNQASVTPGALLPVHLQILDENSWFVNLCGYRFEALVDGEWVRPGPPAPPCSEQPNVAVEAGAGTTLEISVPQDNGPGTYRIVFAVNLGTPLDKSLGPSIDQTLVASNRFRVNPLF